MASFDGCFLHVVDDELVRIIDVLVGGGLRLCNLGARTSSGRCSVQKTSAERRRERTARKDADPCGLDRIGAASDRLQHARSTMVLHREGELVDLET